MDLDGIMLSEISHTQEDKYCMISLKYQILYIKSKARKKLTETGIRFVITRGVGVGEGVNHIEMDGNWTVAITL